MRKKVKKIKEARVSYEIRNKYTGTTGDNQLLQLIANELQLDRTKEHAIHVDTDIRTLETVYSVEAEFEVEDFETIDHNRYEFYLNWFIENIVLKLKIGLDEINDVTFRFLSKQQEEYLKQVKGYFLNNYILNNMPQLPQNKQTKIN